MSNVHLQGSWASDPPIINRWPSGKMIIFAEPQGEIQGFSPTETHQGEAFHTPQGALADIKGQLLANISPTTTASLFCQINKHSSSLTSSSSQPLSKMSSPTPSILVDNPKAENESWETWGERLAEKYKTPAATPGLPLVPGFDKLRTYPTISSSCLIDSNPAFVHSRDLV